MKSRLRSLLPAFHEGLHDMKNEKKINVSAVSYLNTLPMIFGLESGAVSGLIKLDKDTPSVCAEKLLSGKADIGLVPVSVLSSLPNHRIITGYCIGAKGKVRSVMLYSRVPLEKIKTIYLDSESRTSVSLVKILSRHHWHISPLWKKGKPGYEKKIRGTTAGLVIGDRALNLNGHFKYEYDLAAEWMKFTELPFVFACWAAQKNIPRKFRSTFGKAVGKGIHNLTATAKKYKLGKKEETYLSNSISYSFDPEKKKALKLFLKLCSQTAETSAD